MLSDYQPDQQIVYDPSGNRISQQVDGSTEVWTHAAANRLISDGSATFEYDAEGNRIRQTDGTTTLDYSWDHRNRLVSVVRRDAVSGDVILSVFYTYDVNNRRTGRTVTDAAGAETSRQFFVWDGDHVTAELDETGTPTATRLYGPDVDQLFASEDALGEVLWALTDNQNTVRDIATYDSAADTTSVVAHREYDIWGNLLAVSGTSVATSELLSAGYTGRTWDAEANLYYYRARWYDPIAGRFLSEDPLGFAAGDTNVQRYVGNGVPNATDPSGLERDWLDDWFGPTGPVRAQPSDSAVYSDFLRGVFRGMKDGVGDQVEFVTEDIPHFFTETAPWLVDLRNGAVPTLGHHLGEAVGCQLGKTPEDFVNDVKSGARNAADVAVVLNAIRAQDFRGLTARQREIAIAANSLLADIFAAAGRNLTSSQAEAVGHLAGTLIADFVVDSIVVGATGGVGAPKIARTLIKRIDNAPAAIRNILYPLRKGFEAGGELRKKLDRLLRTVRKSPDCKRPHAKRPGSRPNPDGDAVAGSEFLDDRIRTGDVPFAPRVTKVGDYNLTNTVANHLDDVVKRGRFAGEPARPFLNSPHLLNEIMAAGKGVPDKFVEGALRWDVPGTFRGSSGIWELVVDPKTKTILHWNFVR